jgi:hypothetical protein
VVKTNQALGEDPEVLEMTPYHKNWVCVIEGDNLDVEVPALKIGRSAVTLFQADIDRFRAAIKGTANGDSRPDETLTLGRLQQLDDAQGERIAKDFFRP